MRTGQCMDLAHRLESSRCWGIEPQPHPRLRHRAPSLLDRREGPRCALDTAPTTTGSRLRFSVDRGTNCRGEFASQDLGCWPHLPTGRGRLSAVASRVSKSRPGAPIIGGRSASLDPGPEIENGTSEFRTTGTERGATRLSRAPFTYQVLRLTASAAESPPALLR